MPRPLEHYALLGDTRTAALVSKAGGVDWLCLPTFDSGACFAALLGEPEHGHWTVSPDEAFRTVGWEYRPDSLVLETRMATDSGEVRIIDCMPIDGDYADLVRRVEGVHGEVRMRSHFRPRFDYGGIVPWIRVSGRRLHALAGPGHLILDADIDLEAGEDRCVTEFVVRARDTVDFRLAWVRHDQSPPDLLDVDEAIADTTRWWLEWAQRCEYTGDYRDEVVRSAITLKALTYAPSGGIVAAPTTSLPERLGGMRNWDYRFCWIRDATFTLMALLDAGYEKEAEQWREWLVRAAAGRPEQIQILYGVRGERRLPELELDWLPGYADSRPVRVGNGAAQQFQLDVYGELMDALHHSRTHGIPPDPDTWLVQRRLMDFLESNWTEPDTGIWERRGQPQHFTHSKVMAWTAANRAVQAVDQFGLDGPADTWKRLRQEIFDEVCEKGYDSERGTFTEYYGSRSLDAALLVMENVGFLPADDERVRGTVSVIERELCHDGLVQRYTMNDDTSDVDGLPHGEGAFLPCTFWLADSYALQGNLERARALFERVLALRSDVGLLSEEYDLTAGRLIGNYPQALSHITLINTAFNLASERGPAHRRADAS